MYTIFWICRTTLLFSENGIFIIKTIFCRVCFAILSERERPLKMSAPTVEKTSTSFTYHIRIQQTQEKRRDREGSEGCRNRWIKKHANSLFLAQTKKLQTLYSVHCTVDFENWRYTLNWHYVKSPHYADVW